MKSLIIMTSVLFLVFAATFVKAEEAVILKTNNPVCHEIASHKASHQLMKAARTLAIREWKKQTISRFGKNYAIWSVARERKLKCASQKGGSICEAIAKPCRIVSLKLR